MGAENLFFVDRLGRSASITAGLPGFVFLQIFSKENGGISL